VLERAALLSNVAHLAALDHPGFALTHLLINRVIKPYWLRQCVEERHLRCVSTAA